MRCRAPFCKNTSDDASTESKGISFHAFPSEVGLRAAWLRALGKQDSVLQDSAVVCSQHFLDDDICATESGLRQLAAGAVPSTVQVCMICLNTDSRLFLMSKHKMEEAYEKLTGYPPCDAGNLKQALCIQCAQRLKNFSRFRDKSLRARAIMMDLVEKHELITRQHIKMINRTKNQLDNSFVVTTLGPDPCDLHIQEHPSEEQQTDSEVTLQTVVKVEKKDSCDSISFNEDNVVENYDSNAECVKNELPDPCDLHIQEHPSEEQWTDSEATLQTVVKVEKEESCDSIPINEDNAVVDYISNAECVKNEFFASTEECLKETEVPLKYESALFQCTLCCEEFETELLYKNHMDMHTISMNLNLLSQNEDLIACNTSQSETNLSNMDTTERFTCDVCKKTFKRKFFLVEHIKMHSDGKPFACKFCLYKSKYRNDLTAHMRTHTGEKPFNCKICNFRCAHRSSLMRHMSSHTGEKSHLCKLCDYRSAEKCKVERHMKTHTGEKPYLCKLCDYRCAQKSHLVVHMRTHNGDKPYLCELCHYRCARKYDLVNHMRTHTGDKPYLCELCHYRYVRKSDLVHHMRTHTGDKPYLCELCHYKSAQKSSLVVHMRTHNGDKPYLCTLCHYRCVRRYDLVNHMRTHTGEKPYLCKLCDYKCARKCDLVRHMKTHTGE